MLKTLPASDDTEVYDDARSSPVLVVESKPVEVVVAQAKVVEVLEAVEVVEVLPQPTVVVVERPLLCCFTRWFSR